MIVTRLLRYGELGASLLIVAVLVSLQARALHFNGLVGLPNAWTAVSLLALIQALLLFSGFRRFRRRVAPGWLTVGLGSVLVAAAIVAVRHGRQRFHAPGPAVAAGPARKLTQRDSHYFALRIIRTALADHEVREGGPVERVSELTVPFDWPLDSSARFQLGADSASHVVVWSSYGSATTCRLRFADQATLMGDSLGFACSSDAPPPGMWVSPRRTTPTRPGTVENDSALPEQWPQYRFDPGRQGTVDPADTTAPVWRARLAGSARATVSVADTIILVGAHGSGALEARSRKTGRLLWRTAEPNWIHQDPISDGRHAFVGFGDNQGGFAGVSPSGLAAHDLATGERLWTRFVKGAVMTAPVIWHSVVIFGSARSEVLGLDAGTGAGRWEDKLPGRVVMGPPLLVGDTVVFTLDDKTVCALLAPTGKRLWCTTLSGAAGFVGHVAPTLAWGRVFGTSTTFVPALKTLWYQGWHALPGLWAWITTDKPPAYSVQETFALRLHDGFLEWRTPIGHGPGSAGEAGHPSGTPVPVPEDSSLVVVAPFADRLVRLDGRTGARLAVSARFPRYPRGPPLLVGESLLAFDRLGGLRVLRRDDLTERCAIAFPEPVDRAGPTRAGGALLVAGRRGGLYSIPLQSVLACDPTLAARIAALPALP